MAEETQLFYPPKTMYEMVEEMVRQNPDAPAYEFYNKKTTYSEFGKKINAAARALIHIGIHPGDAVTICMPNVPQALDCFYAVDRIGAIANMIHPLSAQKEISFYLNISKSKAILTLDMFTEKVEAALEEVDHPVTVITARIQDELPVYLKAPYSLTSGREFLKYPNSDHSVLWSRLLKQTYENVNLPTVKYDPKRTSVILYSGGTSGTPKGICLTDLNMNALAIQCRSVLGCDFGPGLKMLSCMPMFHGFGLGVNIHTCIVHGLCCILMPNFNIKTYADMLVKKRPNFIAGVPTIFEALLHMPQLEKAKLDYLMGMFCGGDSLTIELKKKVDDFLKEHGASIQVREGYGLTECVTASCLTPKDVYKPGSIGLPFPDTSYAIVKPGTDDVQEPGHEGEIILTGPTVMLEYLDNPEETKHTLRKMADGRTWLYTGDLGYMDEEGYVFFKQRIKRMIITNGYNVYPGQIENVIDSVPEVSYSCVIGVKDERRGQRVKAYVVLRDNVEKSEEIKQKIYDALKKHTAGYAIPKEIEFRDSLPKTLVGKVAFRVLEEEANAELEKGS